MAEGKVVPRMIEDEMKKAYIDYAMSVIIGRALPDVRDGLKPVHRRILYSMNDMNIVHNKPFKKCARIVGDVLGKYHPHGDAAVYDALVRMAQDFSLRYMLVDGQGNFGSIDGDSQAAMRYTEARMTKLSEDMLQDIDKETVNFIPNFDGTLKEPAVLPCRIPNLIVNGSSGIAVGMATNIPPHNLSEVIDAIIAYIANPDITTSELMQCVRGPDFPTGGQIVGSSGIFQAYDTGRGRIKVRGKSEIKEERGRNVIIINEIPYQVNKSMLIETIANLVREKKIVGISDIRDESDRDGLRIVIDIKRDAQPNVILNQLYAHTRLETVFGIIMLSIVDGEPKILSLKKNFHYFVRHRKDVIVKRTDFELRKAEERSHILKGLIIALNNIDKMIQKIKESKSAAIAAQKLIADYDLSEKQAKAILDMKLQKLSSMEQDKIREEEIMLCKKIAEYKSILSSEERLYDIIKEELIAIKEKYGDARRTEIVEDEGAIDIEDLIKDEDVAITVSHEGYIKRLPIDTYKQQGRGGRGVIGAETKEEDFVEHLLISNTHNYILIFTNKGKVHWIKAYQIPQSSRHAKGRPIINLIELDKGEMVSAFIPVKEFAEDRYLFMATKKGTVKKTALSAFHRPRRGGITAINIGSDDRLIGVIQTTGHDEIMLGSKRGMAIRFNEQAVRAMGRTATGVRGIRLNDNDEIVGMIRVDNDKQVLTVTENGYGKRTQFSAYRTIGRGGKGVINIQCSERNGSVVSITDVAKTDDIVIITKRGIIIRCPVEQVANVGRNTQGVRLMRLTPGDKVVSTARIEE